MSDMWSDFFFENCVTLKEKEEKKKTTSGGITSGSRMF